MILIEIDTPEVGIIRGTDFLQSQKNGRNHRNVNKRNLRFSPTVK